MKAGIITIATLCILFHVGIVYGDQTTNSDQIKNTIVSIQNQVVDLTDDLEPLYCKKFVVARKSMTRTTALQIVGLIRQGKLNPVQSDIGVLLLSGLNERTYWVVTEQLLTTNTDDYTLGDLLSPPFPYGPGYANSYKVEAFRKKLHALETISGRFDLKLILNGEDSRAYADYLKHPDRYGYLAPNDYGGSQ